MRGIRGNDIVFITAPFSGFGTSPVGGSIDVVDKTGMHDLGEALRSDTMERLRRRVRHALNRRPSAGRASRSLDALELRRHVRLQRLARRRPCP